MEKKVSKTLKEMTVGRALVGFFVPILVLILLIAFGADVPLVRWQLCLL